MKYIDLKSIAELCKITKLEKKVTFLKFNNNVVFKSRPNGFSLYLSCIG